MPLCSDVEGVLFPLTPCDCGRVGVRGGDAGLGSSLLRLSGCGVSLGTSSIAGAGAESGRRFVCDERRPDERIVGLLRIPSLSLKKSAKFCAPFSLHS